MSYTIKYKNVHFPTWFYPTLRELGEKWQQKHAQGRKNIYALTGDKLRQNCVVFLKYAERKLEEMHDLYIYVLLICMKIQDGQML